MASMVPMLAWLMWLWSTSVVGAHPRAATLVPCVDGAEAVNSFNHFACDRDGVSNGRCAFEAIVRHRGELIQRRFEVSARTTRSVRVRGPYFGRGVRFRLRCIAADPDVVEALACTDGVLAASDGTREPGTVCDFDRACDGVCSFAFACPLCTYGEPGCLLPCYVCPAFVEAVVPVGATSVIHLPRARTSLVMTCASPAAGTACPVVTTTTTVPPECFADDDCLRYPEPCRTCIDGWCTEPVPPGHAFVSCPVPLMTTTTLVPSHCRNDDDCNVLATAVDGCVPLAGCGFCTE
jgi:hypothetical protein